MMTRSRIQVLGDPLIFTASLSVCIFGLDQTMLLMHQLSNASAQTSHPPMSWAAARRKSHRYHATHGASDRWSDCPKNLVSVVRSPQAMPRMPESCKHMQPLVGARSLKLEEGFHCQDQATRTLVCCNARTENPTRLSHPPLHGRAAHLNQALGPRAVLARSARTKCEHKHDCTHLCGACESQESHRAHLLLALHQ